MITRKVWLHPITCEIDFSIITTSCLPSSFLHLSMHRARVLRRGQMGQNVPSSTLRDKLPNCSFLPNTQTHNPKRASRKSQRLQLPLVSHLHLSLPSPQWVESIRDRVVWKYKEYLWWCPMLFLYQISLWIVTNSQCSLQFPAWAKWHRCPPFSFTL